MKRSRKGKKKQMDSRDLHKDKKKLQKWEKRYFSFKPGDHILYIEIGSLVYGGNTYTQEFEGEVLKAGKRVIAFRVKNYGNHKNPNVIPPKIKVVDEDLPSCDWYVQVIILPRNDFQCLNTDTSIVTDAFVSHMKGSLDNQAYWILARRTFEHAYYNLIYQKTHCRFKRCYNLDVDHLTRYKH